MPELPEIEAYRHALDQRVLGRPLRAMRILHPFLLRTASPPVERFIDLEVQATRRIGKRVVFCFPRELFAVIHLMVAGRFHWKEPGAKLHKTRTILAMDFDEGTVQLTEAGKKRRASLHLVEGEEALLQHDRGGLEILEASYEDFAERFREENHTLKRNLSDPRLFSGVGGAFADEILNEAMASPVALSQKLPDEAVRRIYEASQRVLRSWTEALIAEADKAFPEKVTAFRPDMRVHGKYGEPCPTCGEPVQRIVYASRETNYCAKCQTGGKLLADRGLSRLLGKDWPKTPEELERRRRGDA